MQIVNIHQAKTNLSKLLQYVINGKEVIIGKAGVPVAKLVSLKIPSQKRRGGQLKGKIKIAPDFDQLPKNFKKHFAF